MHYFIFLVFSLLGFLAWKRRLPTIDLSPRNITSVAKSKDGWVYVLSNKETFKNQKIHKIGTTSSDINKRLKALHTAVPFDYQVEKTFFSPNPQKLETMLHSYFSNRRVNREFFILSSPKEVEKVVQYIIKTYKF